MNLRVPEHLTSGLERGAELTELGCSSVDESNSRHASVAGPLTHSMHVCVKQPIEKMCSTTLASLSELVFALKTVRPTGMHWEMSEFVGLVR
ncbi:unnamed protein product [Dicrocoelium dendriticum]|nr:unnamed protein product [Dicrocoelium dendriticum]